MGWPKKIPQLCKPYLNYKNNFSVVDGCLMLGHKVVIPCNLKGNILKQLHSPHFGIVKTKSLARSYVWWPQISYDNENVQYKYILVLVDAHTKWLEAVVTSNTKSSATINILRDILSRFGLPFALVSDNATTFKSNEFQTFLSKNNIEFKEIAPFHPASNGQAENAVKTVKQALLKILKRSSLSELNRKSPANLMFQRNIRSVYDFWNNNVNIVNHKAIDVTDFSISKQNVKVDLNQISKSRDNQCKYFKGSRNKTYLIGDHVAVRDYRVINKPSWVKGIILYFNNVFEPIFL
ncbi:uncharacterized protein K02A2.6-like [Diorhabda sublineata]|uniref:uncharacterized protein K02A2.6-like n=1 Tax=Diorhabda sublineata TaxID=1163346 RepID=UPI0024E09D4B|nr:uncharacterized protein K02A2.6-like [Diorhabda sublineata]